MLKFFLDCADIIDIMKVRKEAKKTYHGGLYNQRHTRGCDEGLQDRLRLVQTLNESRPTS